MKEVYILQASPRAFIKSISDEGELIITPDCTQALIFDRIGDAMITAVQTNEIIGISNFRAVAYYEKEIKNTEVSNHP